MLIKIIYIAYNRFKIITDKLYLIITQDSYFLIGVILISSLYQLLSLPRIVMHNYRLAFNINITYLLDDFNTYRFIKKIQLDNCNSIFVKSFLSGNKRFLNINFLDNLYIKNKIEQLKNYGSLKQVSLLSLTSNNIKYITLNFTFNPILKRVKILKQKKLLIPSSILINIFYKQIGLPKNYIKINQSIQDIYQWYKSNGFNWIDIQLIETKKLEEIYLQISEGEVATSYIICTQSNMFSKTIIFNKEKEITKKLGFIKGEKLNIKKIELGIKQLKKSKILNDCTYIVEKNASGLNIFFEYNVVQSNSKFFFQEAKTVNKYKQIDKIWNYYFYKNKLRLSRIPKQIYSSHYKSILNSHKLFKLLILQIEENIKYCTQSLLKHFIIKYRLHKIYYYKQNFTIDVHMTKKNTAMNILFFLPDIKLTNCSLGYIILNFYYEYYKYNLLNDVQKAQLLNLHSSKESLTCTKIVVLGFNISLDKSLNEYIYTKIRLLTQFYRVNQKFINVSKYSQNNYYVSNEINTTLANIFTQNITKSLQQKLIIFRILIKYNTLCLTKQFTSGKLFIIESIYFMPLAETFFNILSSSHSLHLNYNQVYVLPKILKSIYANILFVMIKIDWLVNNKIYKSVLQKSFANIFLKENNINNNLYQALYLYHVEYSTHIFYHLSLYIFCNFTHDLPLYNKIPFSFIYQYSTFNNLSAYEVNIGSGIQFNVPIYKMPTFRIEYKISNKSNSFLQFRLYSKYNN